MSINSSKNVPNVKNLAKKALKDEKLRSELLEGILSKNCDIRFKKSFKTLQYLTEHNPEVLYPEWDYFVELLDNDNAYVRYIAAHLIANLTKIDTKNKFEMIFDKYYELLDGSVMVAIPVATSSGKIVSAKPNLESKITTRLLKLENSEHKHRDLIKSGAIQAFDEYFDEAKNKKKIIEFVRKQLKCESPKTRKIAREFLRKRDKSHF